MSQKVISAKTERNLEILRKAGILKDFYLAGGTGLAIQLEHRVSLDLDFFTKKKIDVSFLIQKIKKIGKFSLKKEAPDTLIGKFNGTRISFLRYDYPCLFAFKRIKKIEIADIRDIGCMKISAISSRGTKKDFVDLFFICRKIIILEKLLILFKKKYKRVDYNMAHILKSLVYFEDAQRDMVPKIIIPVSWEKIKDFFKTEIKNLK